MGARLGRAVVVWLGLFGLAFGNGAVREFALVRVVRPAVAEAISATLLFVLILLAAWCLVRWGWTTPRAAKLARGGRHLNRAHSSS